MLFPTVFKKASPLFVKFLLDVIADPEVAQAIKEQTASLGGDKQLCPHCLGQGKIHSPTESSAVAEVKTPDAVE